MSKTQDAFFEQVGRDYGLERGIHMDGQEKRQHISAQEHELREIKQKSQEGKNDLKQLSTAKKQREHAPRKPDRQQQNCRNRFKLCRKKEPNSITV